MRRSLVAPVAKPLFESAKVRFDGARAVEDCLYLGLLLRGDSELVQRLLIIVHERFLFGPVILMSLYESYMERRVMEQL
jgi:hypothetical protein